MKITPDIVRYVAELANIELSESEVETFRRQLDEILAYVDKLNELDTAGVEPMAQVVAADARVAAAWREDVVRPAGITEKALAAAPDANPPFFRVPKVVERES